MDKESYNFTQSKSAVRSYPNNAVFGFETQTGPEDFRKVRIGDLSVLDKQLQERRLERNNMKIHRKKKQVSFENDILPTQNKYLELLNLEQQLQKDEFKNSINKYNCDPINDPKYEPRNKTKVTVKKIFENGVSVAFDSTNSENTYVSFGEPAIPTSLDIIPCKRVGAVVEAKGQTLSGKKDTRRLFYQQKTFPSRRKFSSDMASMRRKVILGNLRNLNTSSELRPRSRSDPLARKLKQSPKSEKSVTIAKNCKKIERNESTGLKTRLPKAMNTNEQATSLEASQEQDLSIRVTSFTSSGDPVNQEYVFSASPQENEKVDAIIPRRDDDCANDKCDDPEQVAKEDALENPGKQIKDLPAEDLYSEKKITSFSSSTLRPNGHHSTNDNVMHPPSSVSAPTSPKSSIKIEPSPASSSHRRRSLSTGCKPLTMSHLSVSKEDKTTKRREIVYLFQRRYKSEESSYPEIKSYQKSSTFDHRMKNRRRSETVLTINHEINGGLRTRSLHRQAHQEEIEPQRPTARRAAVVSTLPDSDLSHLSDTIANLQRNQPVNLSTQFKRSRWTFPKLAFKSKDKDRSREQKLEDFLSTWKPNTFDATLETMVQKLKNCRHGDMRNSSKPSTEFSSTKFKNSCQRKRNIAVWELFSSERTYLVDHLLVLQQVFMEPLQELQCEGYLLTVDVRTVFGNLEELCKVTIDFCHALLKVVGDEQCPNEFGSAAAIDSAFETFESTVCPPYQRYFSGYNNSLHDREELKTNEDYLLFLKWCEKNPRCQRLTLTDFLVSPMQHLTKYPLLLQSIAKHTDDKNQTASIERTQLAVQEALKTLEGKVTCTNNYQFLQDLQSSISWPPVYELDNKTVLPESLRTVLSQQPCRKLIANPKRRLVLEGFLTVVENGKPFDVYAFLFDDMLLLTKTKKGKRKPSEIPSSLRRHDLMKDGTLLSVHRQPIAMDRFMMYDVDGEQASAMGLKKAFVLIQENRFQQMCSITLLQASTEDLKKSWLKHLASTAAQWMEENVFTNRGKALMSNGSFNIDNDRNGDKLSVQSSPPVHENDEVQMRKTEYLLETQCNCVGSSDSEVEESKKFPLISEEHDEDSESEKSDYL